MFGRCMAVWAALSKFPHPRRTGADFEPRMRCGQDDAARQVTLFTLHKMAGAAHHDPAKWLSTLAIVRRWLIHFSI